MGAFLLHGLTPGPLIFQEAPEVVYAIYIGLILANVMLLGLGLGLIPGFSRLVSVRVCLLFPVVFLFPVIGDYSYQQSVVDVGLAFDLVGLCYLMINLRIQGPPLLAGC